MKGGEEMSKKRKKVLLWLSLLHIIIFFCGTNRVMAEDSSRFDIKVTEYQGIDKKAASVTIKNISGENAKNVEINATVPKSYNAEGKVMITVGNLVKDESKTFLITPKKRSGIKSILPMTNDFVQSYKVLIAILVIAIMLLTYYKQRKLRYLAVMFIILLGLIGNSFVRADSGEYQDNVEKTLWLSGIKYTFDFKIVSEFYTASAIESATTNADQSKTTSKADEIKATGKGELAKASQVFQGNKQNETKDSSVVSGNSNSLLGEATNRQKQQPEDDASETNANYQIEHYKVDPNGELSLADKETKTAKIGQKVKAVSRSYFGYQYQADYHADNAKSKTSGTVKADGKLTLKLYYVAVEIEVPALVATQPADVVTLANAKWRVLFVSGNQALVIKDKPLTEKETGGIGNQVARTQFNQGASYYETGYEGSLVKAKIDFYYQQFIKNDLANAYVLPVNLNLVSEAEYLASANIIYDTTGWYWKQWSDYYGDCRFASLPQGGAIQQAFALSMGDINTYLSAEKAYSDLLRFDSSNSFWLRSAGYNSQKVGSIQHGHTKISSAVNQTNAIRPAMWVVVNEQGTMNS